MNESERSEVGTGVDKGCEARGKRAARPAGVAPILLRDVRVTEHLETTPSD